MHIYYIVKKQKTKSKQSKGDFTEILLAVGVPIQFTVFQQKHFRKFQKVYLKKENFLEFTEIFPFKNSDCISIPIASKISIKSFVFMVQCLKVSKYVKKYILFIKKNFFLYSSTHKRIP